MIGQSGELVQSNVVMAYKLDQGHVATQLLHMEGNNVKETNKKVEVAKIKNAQVECIFVTVDCLT